MSSSIAIRWEGLVGTTLEHDASASFSWPHSEGPVSDEQSLKSEKTDSARLSPSEFALELESKRSIGHVVTSE